MYGENVRIVHTSIDTSVAYLNKLNYRTHIIQMAKKRIMSLPFIMVFKKHSCLAPIASGHVEWLASSGFLKNWEDRYHDQRFLKKRITKEPQILSLDQLYGVYSICLVLYMLSIIVFIFEMFATNCRMLRIVFEHV